MWPMIGMPASEIARMRAHFRATLEFHRMGPCADERACGLECLGG